MVDATTFVTELEAKHLETFRQLVAAYVSGLVKETMSVTDALKLELRAVVEAVEVAALWLPDSDQLAMKMALATRCGDCAQHFGVIADRLGALGVPADSFDPRHGRYSKLFAFFRSLQTTEERTARRLPHLGSLTLTRFEAVAAFCDEKGETAALYRGLLSDDERRHVDAGRRAHQCGQRPWRPGPHHRDAAGARRECVHPGSGRSRLGTDSSGLERDWQARPRRRKLEQRR
jgi:hypothetical protein